MTTAEVQPEVRAQQCAGEEEASGKRTDPPVSPVKLLEDGSRKKHAHGCDTLLRVAGR